MKMNESENKNKGKGTPLYKAIGRFVEWYPNNIDMLKKIHEYLPSGSGFEDAHIDMYRSKKNRVYIKFTYHHMNDNGYYVGYTHHTVRMTPSLFYEFDLHITKGGIRDPYVIEYFYDVFYDAMNELVEG